MFCLLIPALLACQASPGNEIARIATETLTYKQASGIHLELIKIAPAIDTTDTLRAAIVFFHGGGWRNGSPEQFIHQAKALAQRGMVAFLPEYRLSGKHGVKVPACVEDAKSAMRFIRRNAGKFGIDSQRIVAAGGSAGGHLALATTLLPGFNAATEDSTVRCTADALVLFNPPAVLSSIEGKFSVPAWRIRNLRARMGLEPRLLSPYHHIRPGLPPSIIFHGTNDTTVPFETASLFAKSMQQAGNDCELVAFEGFEHSFFNYGRNGNKPYQETLEHTERFLSRLGYLGN